MAYQVLARKWRPRSFETMVGQEHVLRALVNALDKQMLHHAYLFTGTRGVGKTTVARVFAKALNCELGVSSKPCGECSSCKAIDAGRFVDLIEVDAASRTGVDDTRELLDNVQYMPTQGRFKVYLIDEVHMFSTHSFNALLKTLEEPPAHVKFLLATTDPQKLLATILSRCLQFNLKRLSSEQIRDYLGWVLGEEGISYDPPAMAMIARAADGSMRDGLSLLDQAIGFGGGRVGEDDVQTMLGSISRDDVLGVIADLADGDSAALMARVAAAAEQGPDYASWLADLISALQRIALIQQVPDAVDDAFGDPARLVELAQRISAEDAQLFYQIGLIGRRDLPLSPEPRGGFEMILLRMLAFKPVSAGFVPVAAGSGAATASSSGGAGVASASAPALAPAPAPTKQRAAVAAPAPTTTAGRAHGGPDVAAGAVQSKLDQARALLGERAVAPSSRARAEAASPVDAVSAPAFAPAPPGPDPAVPKGDAALNTSVVSADSGPVVSEQAPDSVPYPGYRQALPEASPGWPVAGDEFDSPPPDVAAADGYSAAASAAVVEPPQWLTLMPKLGLDGVVQELAAHCIQMPSVDDVLTLALDPAKIGLLNDDRLKRIRDAVGRTLARPLRVDIAVAQSDQFSPAMVRQQARDERLRQAEQSIANDALVRAMQERMGASVQPDSVRPLD